MKIILESQAKERALKKMFQVSTKEKKILGLKFIKKYNC